MGEKVDSFATDRGLKQRPVTLYERLLKPVLDRFLGLLLGIITLPALLVLWFIVRIAFGAPAIRRTAHVGKSDTRFNLYKLRTSETHTNNLRGRRRKLSIFLREWSLDELPQFWNVALGHMSMVGPRPITPALSSELTDWERERHGVKPGLTGLWQVDARGDGRRLRDNIHYDIQYIDQLSLVTDLRILARSVVAFVFHREGGARPKRQDNRLRSRLPHIRLISSDLIVWGLALSLAVLARLDFNWVSVDKTGLAVAVTIAVAIQLAWGIAVGLYRGKWRLASYEEIAWVASGTAAVTLVLLAITALPGENMIPRGAIVGAGAFQLIGALAIRYLARAVYTTQGKSVHQRPHKLLIFGAGEAGLGAAHAIMKDPQADILPVALLDDEAAKHGSRLEGLLVVGGRETIARAAERYNADTLLIAMPTATGTAVGQVADRAARFGLRVLILPRLAKSVVASGEIRVSDIREINLGDFLSREVINLDVHGIANYLSGKRVLVTGAGGSIGSVLCQIINQFEPQKLFKLDRDENALHALQLGLEGRALLDSDDLILCDIRDREAVLAEFTAAKPDVVFHAAALKHVTFLERYPDEAYKTNVSGTLNVLQAACEVGTEVVVNISSDKAADPKNTLGITKRIGERLTTYFSQEHDADFMSVRFGNVLGSKGSVVPTFHQQIINDEPITITDPEVTRFFMTIEEACQLVVQAGAIGGNGDVLVLDMGEPVKIIDLALHLQAQLRPGTPANFVFTGLRAGEKLHEVLAGPDEELVSQPHELIARYSVPPLDPANVDQPGANSDIVGTSHLPTSP